MKNKKGLSPIIATVLLIVIAIALFVIIFLWVKSFQAERISKFGAPIENSCPDINLQLSIIGSDLQIENNGNVPVFKIQIFSVDNEGSTTKIEDKIIELNSGGETSVGISTACSGSAQQLKIIPVLLGTDESGNQQEYICTNRPIVISCS